jgi:hypothetical protein
MFENVSKTFNGIFGKVEPGKCRVTMNGGIAVKCSNGDYKTYNVKKGRLTNVTNFCFNIGDEMFFILPTTKAKVGDILLIGGKPKCVIETNKKTIKVIDYDNSEIREVVPERHVFMGSTYFYGKVVSMFGNSLNGGSGIKNIIKMSMISQMMGGGNNNGGMLGGGLGQMMAMSMLMNGKMENPFEGMFDLEFDADADFDGIEDEDDETEEEEDSIPTKKAKKTKKSKED